MEVIEEFTIRLARPADIDDLLVLMRGYYRDDGLDFDPSKAKRVMLRLLSEPQWGCAGLIHNAELPVGYAVLCVGYSLELGGNEGFIDELYVEPDFRGGGIAQRLLDLLESEARERNVAAIHLEVDKENISAQRLYSSRGYRKRDRYCLMTKGLP